MTLLLLLLLVVAPIVLGGVLGALAWPRRPRFGRAAGALTAALVGAYLLWATGGLSLLTGANQGTEVALGSIRDQCRALRAAIIDNCRGAPGPDFAQQCTRNRAVFIAECVSRRHVAAMP